MNVNSRILVLQSVVIILISIRLVDSCDNDTQFTCDDGRCISLNWQCDDFPDCDFGEDEKDCTCEEGFKCPEPDYTCQPPQYVCDDWKDCSNGADEKKCNCTGKFECFDGYCFRWSWVCDGFRDCNGGEDEFNCPTTTAAPCLEHTCPNGKCIPDKWKCDLYNDCGDWSDELLDCDCSIGETFNCTNPPVCIHSSWQCDDDVDCPDGSDEANCPKNMPVIGKHSRHIEGNNLKQKRLRQIEKKSHYEKKRPDFDRMPQHDVV